MEQSLLNSPATLILLVLTIGISLLAFNNPGLWRFLALEPYRMIRDREFHGVVTSGFLHGGIGHLALNMLTLYFFGPTLEHHLGGSEFLLVYAVSLVAGSLWPLIKYRNQPNYVAIGASGAISGLLFSFCLYFPLSTIYLFFAIPIYAFLFTILYIGYSVYAMKNVQDNIGHEAHLGGAVGGIVVTILLNPSVIPELIDKF